MTVSVEFATVVVTVSVTVTVELVPVCVIVSVIVSVAVSVIVWFSVVVSVIVRFSVTVTVTVWPWLWVVLELVVSAASVACPVRERKNSDDSLLWEQSNAILPSFIVPWRTSSSLRSPLEVFPFISSLPFLLTSPLPSLMA